MADTDPTGPDPFLSLLNKAAQLVAERYPAAGFCEAKGEAQSDASSAASFSQWTFSFLNGKGYVSVTYQGRFADPVAYPNMLYGDQPITEVLAIGLDEALSRLRASGCKDDLRSVVLRKPLYPGITEPLYIFPPPGPGGPTHVVGACTGDVQQETQNG